MKYRSIINQALKWLVVASLLGFGFAMAQSEPTLNQVYTTAKEGKLDQAQLMIQQVLIAHPNSAKAFFIRSELYARQGDLEKARESLANAEKLAPGLPFAKTDALQALRAQLSAKKTPAALSAPTLNTTPASNFSPVTAPTASSWAPPLLLAGGVIVLGYFIFRKKKPAPDAQPPAYANQGGLLGHRALAWPVALL